MESGSDSFVKAILGLLGVLFVSALVVFYIGFQNDKEVDAKTAYIQTQFDTNVTVIANTVTDEDNDFFVVTEDDEDYYVTITGEDKVYTHTSKQMSEDTETLNEMKTTSIDRKNKPQQNSDTSFVPFFIPIN